MSAIELKERLIEKIQETTNESILEEAFRLLELENNETTVYQFTDTDRADIEAIRLHVQQGRFITDDEANKEIDEWLNK